VKGTLIPDSNEEYLLYQTLIGAWPFSKEEIPTFKQRVKAYFVKAAREAKVHTSWIDPDDAHENALVSFVDGVLENTASNKFLEDFLKFQQKIAFYGAINSLGQGLLKVLSPGVPDFYQGTELWDLSLVDPDNRRPVDFSTRIKLLDELKGREPAGPVGFKKKLLANWRDDRIKLYLLSEALEFRRTHGELFLKGNYIPLKASGRRSENICAYARREKDLWALVVIPRFSTRLVSPGEFPLGSKVWGRSHLVLPEQAPCHWKDLLSGKTLKATQAVGKWVLPLHQVLQHFPVALLSTTTP
jgi:(1->4)-alpha-D-glucan 1-alpha-D-glucosylmutase